MQNLNQVTKKDSMKPREIGQFISDFNTFEKNLSNNIDSDEIYFTNDYSNDRRSIPTCLLNVINEFNSVWIYSSKYRLDKVVLFNFNILNDKDESKYQYPSVWKHFTHTGCVLIFNPNDINFKIEINRNPEQYSLVAGGMVFIETDVMFRFLSEDKSTKLKHLVVYSFEKVV